MTPSSQPLRPAQGTTGHTPSPGAADAITCLAQGVDLLRGLTDQQYVASLPPTFASGLGAHVRHIIDHVDCLLDGLHEGRVDYDQRRREQRTEHERAYALEQLIARVERLCELGRVDANTTLLVNSDTGCGSVNWSRSTLARECQFVVSHTIHHYALIAAILAHSDLPVPTDFGISPSTLRHRDASQAR